MNFDLQSFCEKVLDLHPSDLILSGSEGEIYYNRWSEIDKMKLAHLKRDILNSKEFQFWKSNNVDSILKLSLDSCGDSVELSKLGNELFYIKKGLPIVDEHVPSDEAYRLFFENNITPVFKTSEFGQIVYANQSYARLFGFESVEELKNYTSIDFYPDPMLRKEYLRKLKAEGVLKNFYMSNRTIQGKEIALLVNARVVNEDGKSFIEGSLLDITAQVRSEKELKEKNEELQRLSTVLENISDAVHVVDESGNLVYINSVAKERFGISGLTERKLNIFEVSPYFKTAEQFTKHFQDLKKVKEFVVESLHKNVSTGEMFPTELSIRHAYIHNAEFLIATGRDISQKLIDREKLTSMNNKLNELNKAINSTSLVSITAVDGKIVEVNDKFCEVSGYSREELIGSNHNIVSSHTHTTEFWRNFYQTISSGNTWVGEICNRKKSGEHYWVRTVIYPIHDGANNLIQFMSIRQEITKEKEAERQIEKHLNFQDLLVNIALRMMNVDPKDFDATINHALQDIGIFVGADRSYIFDYDVENEVSNNLYEWCQSGIEPQIDKLQNVPFSDIPEWIKRHFKGEIMDIPSVADLPDSLLRELLEIQDIKSLIALPLIDGEKCIGFVGFDSVVKERPFTEKDKQILELFSYMLVNIQKRILSIRLVEEANEQIKEINNSLNVRIAEEMDKTSQLTQSMASLDKMAMIGELTSGLAHDLNTPLGAIKVGTESVRFMLENLFKTVLEGNTVEQIHFACSRAVESNFTMFVGGIQGLKESKELLNYLENHFSEVEDRAELVKLFVKARITADETEVIDKIMISPNRREFLDLIYHIQAIRTFIDTVLEAGEKAKSVVESLRFYIKEGKIQNKVSLDLKDNILKVINVLNHLIKQYDINLTINLQEGIEIQGIPERLYQLWSNLIRNAIDATGFNGDIEISSAIVDDRVTITVKNTGDTIPEEIQNKIWKKFFSTKEDKGTGLGLSIVKRVVEEHEASIEMTSRNKTTAFYVSFKLNQ